MTALTHFEIDYAGQRVACTRGGDPARPTILFLHGYPDSQRVWWPLMERLATHNQVATFDFPGVGG